MNNHLKLSLVAICVFAAVTTQSDATVIVGNSNPDDVRDVRIFPNSLAAASFTMLADSYTLTDVLLRLQGYNGPDDAQVSINLDSGTGTPGSQFALLNDPAFTSLNSTDYLFTPSGVVTLAANTTYWLVVASPGGFLWKAASDSTIGTSGVATFNEFATSTNGGASWAHDNPSYDLRLVINGERVPTPTVPEAGSTAILLGITLMAFALASHRLQLAKAVRPGTGNN